MNPFERARESALALREKLLRDRTNEAVTASELLLPVESELNIGIERLAAGAPELGSGDACLRRDDQYIYVRKDVSLEEYAHLVAHELGHLVLDVDKTEITIASLATIDEINGGPATVKVEAYGARERQELQANVFAREFLLPRHIARQLFNSGSGPRKIALDLKIPIRIAREQVLDAILFPIATDPSPTFLHPPTDDQFNAARANERFTNVIAGPGTGKTSTLIHRVKYLIEEQKVDPSHLLVLTFTNKAAFELIDRLRSAGIARAADIWAGTFHAFGLEFLRKYHDLFGLPSNVIVVDKLNAITILNRDLPNIPIAHYLRIDDPYQWLGRVIDAIKRLKEELVSPDLYRQRLSTSPCDDQVLAAERNDLYTLYHAYERLLRSKGLVDFVDLVALPAISIRSDRARYSELADKFQHILIDEYQDVTEAMVQLVKQLAQKGKSLWVVGDIRQAIHHWRGASFKSLMVFEQTFREQVSNRNAIVGKYPLTINRRSSQEIVDVITHCGEKHVLQQSFPLSRTTSSSGKGDPTPTLVSCSSKQAIPEAIATQIQALRASGYEYSQQVVLSRRTADVELLARELHDRHIPVLYIGELAQRAEVKRLLCLMQLLSERQPRALVGLTLFGGLPLSIEEINEIIGWSDQSVQWQRGRWIHATFNDLSQNLKQTHAILSNLLRGHSRHSMPWDFLCDVLLEHRFGLPPLNDQSIDAHVKRIALWQFLNSVLIGDAEGKKATLSRYLLRQQLRQRIGETYGDRELPSEASALNAVRVQTVHGSKGLEYAAVHVGYVDKDSFGHEKSTWRAENDISQLVPPVILESNVAQFEFEQAIERNNLFYVAVSRAQRSLTLYEDEYWANRNQPAQIAGQPTIFSFSKFNGTEAPPPAKIVGQLHNLTGALEFNQFETYERCPLQYRYRFEIGLGREQEIDVSLRASLAVMAALKDLANGSKNISQEALEMAWSHNRLPPVQEDVTLWRDAQLVFDRGVDWIQKSGGTFVEPVTTLGKITIRLPWMLARTQRQGAVIYDLLRFSSRGVNGAVTLLRPMLNGLNISSMISICNITHAAKPTEVMPSGKVDATNAMAAANRFVAGDRTARKGTHCRFCPYLTICPANPPQ